MEKSNKDWKRSYSWKSKYRECYLLKVKVRKFQNVSVDVKMKFIF